MLLLNVHGAVRALIITFILGGVAYPIAGCFTVRARSLEWPGVRATAEGSSVWLPQRRPFRFHFITVDHTKGPPPYAIQMPDGTWVTSDRLTNDVLKPHLRPSPHGEPDWHLIRYPQGYVYLEIKENRAKRLHIGSDRVGHWVRPGAPMIGRPDGKARHRLPVLESELIEIFGNPVATSNYWFDT